METQNQDQLALERRQQQDLVIYNQKVEQIGQMVWRMDMVLAFPLDEMQIENWSKTILRLCPNATQAQVAWIVDKYLTGEWEFDKDMGIANIVKALRNPRGIDWRPR